MAERNWSETMDRVRAAFIHPTSVWWGPLILALVLGLAVGALLWAGYGQPWTGLGPYLNSRGEWEREKTLWDWMELLLVPGVLAAGAAWFSWVQNKRQREAEERRVKASREIETDRFREAALQEYIDRISDLVLERDLRESSSGTEVRDLAKARTMTVLRRLDRSRRGALLRFLHGSGLIARTQAAVDLNRADLGGAYLARADLSRSNLSGAILREAFLEAANLRGADLSEADLQGARLVSADLRDANLSEARLGWSDLDLADLRGADLTGARVTDEQLDQAASLKGATLPDGTMHE